LVFETWEKYDQRVVAHRRISPPIAGRRERPSRANPMRRRAAKIRCAQARNRPAVKEFVRKRRRLFFVGMVDRRTAPRGLDQVRRRLAEYRRPDGRYPHISQALQPGIEPVHARFTRAYL
jgi:hypothetical protein